jgi:hypothetical protein
MVLSIGFRNSVSFFPAIQATEFLTFTPVGLSPTEHASLCWTRTLPFATPSRFYPGANQKLLPRRLLTSLGRRLDSVLCGSTGRPAARWAVPSYFRAISFRRQASQAGVTMVALSAITFRPNALALTANRRRGRHQTAIAHRTGREEPDSPREGNQ